MHFNAVSSQRAGALCLAAALALSALGFWLAVSPQAIPRLFPQQDKLEHFLAFAALAGLASINARALVWRAMSVSALTVLVEIGQAVLSTTREPSWNDVLAGLLGVAFAIAALKIWREGAVLATAAARRKAHRHAWA